MPATRRKSHGPATSGGQSTLSFGSRAKVTKPSSAATSKAKHIEAAQLPDVTVEDLRAKTTSPEPDRLGPTKAEVVAQKQVQAEQEKTAHTPEIEEAEGISESRLKAYWRAREAERKAGRVHQEGLGVHEKILRHFDLSSQYGPCVGVARLKRWNRANGLGLQPPIEVLAVLLKEEAAGNTKTERAHMDELLSTRFVLE
ncbi:MAG: hypothetical protein M1832_003617 [Thelocarpon impressellum]|nr:MAG: hypothetical protein M1832_003617 [Thelocarpon impressellum]